MSTVAPLPASVPDPSSRPGDMLVLEPLAGDRSRRAWRLCDRRVPATDAEYVLAYVERGDGGWYDVIWVLGGVGTERFASVDDVRAAAARRGADSRPHATKPVPIAARPPRSLRRR